MKRIYTNTEEFLSLSHTSQALYLHLVSNKDVMESVSNYKVLLRAWIFKEEDLNELIEYGVISHPEDQPEYLFIKK